MKKLLLTLLIALFTIQLGNAQAPTNPASGLYFDALDGSDMRLRFNRGDGAKILIIAKEGSAVTSVPTDGIDYTANTDFGLGYEIVTDEFIVYEGNSTIPVIRNLNHSTTYHFRVFEFNGVDSSTQYLTSVFAEGSETTLTAPTLQASNITFSNILGYQMTVNWTNGDGSGTILIAREDEPVNIEPSDLASYYASQSYNLQHPAYSNEIGVGNYVIYQGASTSATITNIDPNKTYHFAVFSYNGVGGKVYLRPGAIAEQITSDFPTIPASNFNPYNIDGNQFNYTFTKGNGKQHIVIAKEGSAVTAAPVDGTNYTGDINFGDGQDLGDGNFVVNNGTGTITSLRNLNPNTTYYLKIFEYNINQAGNESYYLLNPALEVSQTTLTAPTTQASNITFSNVLGTSMTVDCVAGNGSGRIIIVRANTPVDVEPTDLIGYFASSTYNLQHPAYSNEIGTGNYVISTNSYTAANATNLVPNTTYHFAIFEFNGSNGKLYLKPAITGSQITPAAPTLPATNLVFSAIDGDGFTYQSTRGNGIKQIVVLKAGSPVTFTPIDGVSYPGANGYLNNASDLGDGNFVIYNTSSYYGYLNDLQPETTYYLKIYEYNGSDTNTFYLTNPALEGSQATLSAPTTQASNIAFTDILGESMKVNWTGGDGEGRILIIRENDPVDVEPTDLVNYGFQGNSYRFNMSLNEIGVDNYIVHKSAQNITSDIIKLKPNTTYHFALFEYNGGTGKMYLRPGATASQVTATKPTVAASNLNFSNIDGNRISYSLTKGNGAKRIIVARQGASVNFTPIDGVDYIENSTFGSGADLGDGNFIIADFNSFTDSFDGLSHSTTYYVKVFEYNGAGTNTYYLTSATIEGNETTLSPPTVQTSSISLIEKTTTSLKLSWTKGNGTSRLIIAKEEGAVDTEPIDYITYSTYTQFGYYSVNGVENYGIYQGTGTTVNVWDLKPNTTYHFSSFEYNGSNGKLYLRPGEITSFTTKAATPTQQVSAPLFNEVGATSMQINYTKGNGTHRLVLAKKDGAVDANPSDFSSYLGDKNFGDGAEIGSGNFVVFNDTQEEFILKNLDHSSTYHFAFYEYAIDPDDGELYFTPGLIASQDMPTIPQFASTNYTTSPPCTPDVDIEWTVSDAEGRVVIVSEAPLNTTPSNATNYAFHFDFGIGTAIGNGFVVYKGTGDLVPINNLLANTIYYVNIFEYNGTEEDPLFNTTPLSGTIGDIIPPTAISKNITLQLDSNGDASIVATSIDDGSTDTGCGGNTLSIDISDFDCSNLGSNTVRLTVTDNYGNTNFSDATVTIEDNIKPSLTSVADKIVEPTGGTCDFTLLDYTSETTATDNCTIQSVTQSPVAGTIISGESTQQIITLTANDGNGNTEITTFTVTLDCTVLNNDEFELDGFTIYPNPVMNELTIKNGNETIQKIELYDLTGKKIKVIDLSDNKIDLSSFTTGVYILKIETNNGTSIHRIIKE